MTNINIDHLPHIHFIVHLTILDLNKKNNFAGISLRLYQLRYPSIFCGLAKMLYDNILRSCGLIAKLISDDDSSRENGTIKIYDIETA